MPYSRHQVLMEGPQPRLHAREFAVIFVLIRARARGGVLLKFAAGLRCHDFGFSMVFENQVQLLL